MRRSFIVLALMVAACTSEEPPNPAALETAAGAAEARSTLAQLMRGLLYPSSEIIFAAQSEDPEEAAAAAEAAQSDFSGAILYDGWEGVENASLMLAESAALLQIPGRLCENGLPVPLGNEDFQRFAQGLIDAGRASYEAARMKSVDAMLEASGVVSDACSACHEVYRDVPEDQMRCVAAK
jgi:hypothetical protein